MLINYGAACVRSVCCGYLSGDLSIPLLLNVQNHVLVDVEDIKLRISL